MFKFDDGHKHPDIAARSAMVEPGQLVRITDYKRCAAEYNKISENIAAHEDVDALRAYWDREDLVLEAICLFDPHVYDELAEQYETQIAILRAGEACEARMNSGW